MATYSYNYENRMTQVQYPGQTVLGSYLYDGEGRRVQRVEGGTTTNFAYDGDRVLLELNTQGQTQARYTLEGDSYYSPLISMKRSGATSYYLYDGLGSTRKLIDSNQTVTDSYAYEAFGDITGSSGSTTNPYRYVGALGYSHPTVASGLLHVGARWYAPGRGRFTTQDALHSLLGRRPLPGSDQGPHLCSYPYCANNPVVSADPEGRVAWMIACIASPLCRAAVACLGALVGRGVYEIVKGLFAGGINWCRVGCAAVCSCVSAAVGSSIAKNILVSLFGASAGLAFLGPACIDACCSVLKC